MTRRRLGHILGEYVPLEERWLKVVKPTTATPIYDALVREVGDPLK